MKRKETDLRIFLSLFFFGGLFQACVITGPVVNNGNTLSFQEGKSLYDQGRYLRAAEKFTDHLDSARAVGDDALTARVYLLRGECYEALKKYNLARSDYRDARR
ncbi:MAG: tetratricopeptide repeat protein, partial [Planctomycetes bacterium]|nr:tetratricopeptide repeat protein [Planctomycetota bacterium]